MGVARSHRAGISRRAALAAGLAALAALVLGRLLPRTPGPDAASAHEPPPGREARWWRRA